MTVLDQFGRVELLGRVAPGVRNADAGATVGPPPRPPLRALLVGADALAVVAAWAAVHRIAAAGDHLLAWAVGAVVAVATAFGALAAAGLYRSRVSSVRAIELSRLPRVAALATATGALTV